TLPTSTTWSGVISGNLSRSYDNDLRLASQGVNGASVIPYQYDFDGLLTGAGNLTLTSSAQDGSLASTTLGSTTDSLGYTGFGEFTSYGAAFSSSNVYSAQYTRDPLGRIAGTTETISGTTDSFDYSYDVAGRLIGVSKNGVPTSSYTYDDNGNRMTGPA